jgi:hypothetical protein
MKSTLAIVAFILAAFTLVGSIDYATEVELAAEHYAAALVLTEMLAAWAYFSEYCVPIGIKERIEALLGVQS